MFDLQVVFFFYGLAFLAMGVVIFLMPQKRDLLNLAEDLRFVGLFGLFHGANEWVDLLILSGGPFDVEVLKVTGALLLPVSFTFLVAFGTRILFRGKVLFRYMKYLWMVCLAGWAGAYFLNSDFLIAGIAARYFICLPGTLMTAAGLLLILKRTDEKTLPKIVSACTFSAAVLFVIYGVLSGLVVPQADFFFASAIHYTWFAGLIGLPVQFFRMICAIALAGSFFGITGIYSLEMKKVRLRGGVRRKITAIIFSLSGGAIVLIVVITFIWLHMPMIKTIEKHQMEMTRLLAESIKQILTAEIEEIEVHVGSPVWTESIAQTNLKYAAMASGAIAGYLSEMDKKWRLDDRNSDFFRNVLSNPMSLRLRSLVDIDKEVAEIFLTDRYGGLVAASETPSDFYQADEEWWQKAYQNGQGSVFVGACEKDESSGAWSIPVAVPVRDLQGRVIGICKESLDVRVLFSVLESFRFGKTGHAALIDNEGKVVFHKGRISSAEALLKKEEMRKLYGQRISVLWRMENEDGVWKHKFDSFVLLDFPDLLKNGVVWYVVVSQDSGEVFLPLRKIEIGLPVLLLIVLSGTVIAGLVAGEKFARPIRELRIAAGKIMVGNWEFENKIRTGDEIEDLSHEFCRMTAQLKGVYENLEQRVQGKTLELSSKVVELEETKQAILNVLDDLNVEKNKLEESETKLKETAVDLNRSNAELEQFAYIASHDLQEPLRMVTSYVQLLAQRYRGKLGTDADEFIGFAVEGALRMRTLISDLLEYSRVGTRGIPFVPTDCRVILGWALTNLKMAIEESHSQVEIGELPEITADASQMLQLFQNLVANAIKFRKKEGIPQVRIAAREETGEWLFSVSDNGIGFEAKYAERIFGIFQRLHGREEYPGSGIGLAVCKKIVERHGGRIWAESEAGKGSVFYFTIPIRERKT